MQAQKGCVQKGWVQKGMAKVLHGAARHLFGDSLALEHRFQAFVAQPICRRRRRGAGRQW